MKITEKPVSYYLNRLKKNDYYSFPGYSDAEWFAMTDTRIGQETAAGQVLTKEIGARLRKTLEKEYDTRWLPAAPKVLNTFGQVTEFNLIAKDTEFYERDVVTDEMAERAELAPFIRQLRKMDVYIVGNVHFRGLQFLNYKALFEIPSINNAHKNMDMVDTVTRRILMFKKPGVYLFSVGMSSAEMISQLHGKMGESFLLDVGSIWDAFVGIGGQREWRKRLYDNPKLWAQWVTKNLRNV